MTSLDSARIGSCSPTEDSEDVIGNEEESRVAVEPKAISNTKLEVTRDVESISATTKYKYTISAARCEFDGGENLSNPGLVSQGRS